MVFQALNEVDTRGAIAKLIGATKLEVDVVGAKEVEEIVALNKGIAKLGIRDTGATFADALLDKLTIEELSHTEGFADFAEEGEEFDIFEPIIVVYELGAFGGMGNLDDLLGESDFVLFDFIKTFEVTLDGVFGVANLAGSATDEVIRSITVTNEACAHHESSEMANM